jgi:hypothetical protein
MENDETQEIQQSSGLDAPRLPRSYNFLIQLSRQMGTVAAKSSIVSDVRSFMNQEISIAPSEKVFGGALPKLTVSRPEKVQTETEMSAQSKAQKKEKDLKKIVSQSTQVLMTANTVFPMSLFPDTVTLDRTKVTITRRDFFWSSDTLSIRIEDILNVQVSLGPLFGSLTIASRVMSTVDHFKIGHLWRSDAIRLKHIIQGYMIAQHNKIDTSHLSKDELIETLVELGRDSN